MRLSQPGDNVIEGLQPPAQHVETTHRRDADVPSPRKTKSQSRPLRKSTRNLSARPALAGCLRIAARCDRSVAVAAHYRCCHLHRSQRRFAVSGGVTRDAYVSPRPARVTVATTAGAVTKQYAWPGATPFRSGFRVNSASCRCRCRIACSQRGGVRGQGTPVRPRSSAGPLPHAPLNGFSKAVLSRGQP